MTQRAVLLVHGLHMHGRIMAWLARYLRRHGYTPHLFSYNSRQQSLAAHVVALQQAITVLDSPEISLVGHSLGGVLILRALENLVDPRLHRAVVLGSPLASCEIGAHLAVSGWGQAIIGPLIRDLCRSSPCRVPKEVEVAAIAGNRPFGLGRLIHQFASDNDGTIAVAETRLDGLKDHLVLPVSHMGMIFDTRVARQVLSFLEHGHFNRHLLLSTGSGSPPPGAS